MSPLIGLFIGQNFDSLSWYVLGVTLNYGAFITSVVNFIILALVVFLLVKSMNRLLDAQKTEVETVPVHQCRLCKTEIHPEATRCPACTADLSVTT